MNIALWIAQGFLALFVMAGFMKATRPKEALAPRMPWVNDFSATQVKLIGVSQIFGGIGVIVPWWTGIAPFLTPLAALGLALIMILAAIYHLRKGEYKEIGVNIFFMVPALFVAIGRFF